jgi:hypothetical protein
MTDIMKCNNPDCKVAETGKCLEGLPPDQCPHRISENILQPSEQEVIANQDPANDTSSVLELPSGKLLTSTEVIPLLRGKDCRVIALIGPNDAGKTTLVTSFYELFLKGPLNRFYFTTSKTLYGFEQVCHLGRAESRRVVPDTERTSTAAGLKFFHLELFDELNERPLNFLFSERSGESYKSAADDPNVVTTYQEIGYSDCISIVVDGKRISDLGLRHNAKMDTELMIQGLVDSDVLRPEQRLAIILTKYDEIILSGNDEKATNDFKDLVDKIQLLHSEHFSDIVAFKTAARPESSVIPQGLGLFELLQFWAMPKITIPYNKTCQTPSLRAFGRLSVLERNRQDFHD